MHSGSKCGEKSQLPAYLWDIHEITLLKVRCFQAVGAEEVNNFCEDNATFSAGTPASWGMVFALQSTSVEQSPPYLSKLFLPNVANFLMVIILVIL